MTVPAATPDSSVVEDAHDDLLPPAPRAGDDEEEEGETHRWSSPSLCIPVTSSAKAVEGGLFVEIFPDELAGTPASTLAQVLRDERADVGLWSDAALMYMRQNGGGGAGGGKGGGARESLSLLEEANQLYTDDKEKKVRVLAATGIAHLAAAAAQHQGGGGGGGPAGGGGLASKRAAAGAGTDDADRLFTQASKVDTFFPMTWIGRGMLNLSTGRLDQAKFFFQTTLKQCGPVLPALLGMAAVCYGDRDYRQAQQKYGEAIRQYPEESGAPARVGFGLACYRLGQVDRAKAAFARALAMDPECVEAMVGTALLGMAGVDEGSPAFSQETEKAIKMLSMANLLDHSNAMVQNHLANHYFWKWTPVTGTVQVAKGSRLVRASQPMPLDPNERIRIGNKFETTVLEDPSLGNDDDSYQFLISDAWKEDGVGDGDGAGGLKVWKKDYDRVTALAKGAYASTAVQEIQAESLFFLARVYHVRDEMDSAHKVYEKACKLAPDLAPARFGLAQTLVVKGQHDAAMAHLASILDKPSGTATDALALLGLLEVKSGGTKFDEGLAHVRKAIDLDPLNPRLLALEALALRQRRSTYGEALERYRGAIELTQRHRRERVPHDVYANAGVLCHETKRYDDAMAMYRLALDALDGSGLMREPTLDNAGVEGGRVREDDNDMFCGYVDSFVEAQRDPESDVSWKVTSPAGGDRSALSLRVGDRIRIADSFVSEIVEIVESEDGSSLSLVVKDAVRVAEDSEEDGDGMASHPVFVVRENQILKIPEALTIAFNIARLHEVRGRTLAAIELHKAILKRSPSYVNSSLRLACIAVDCGSLKECGEWLKIAAATAPSNPEVLTLIGNLHLSLCDWAAAQPVFDGLLAKKDSKVEAYAALSLGNIYFANLHVSEKRYGKHLQYAADFYKRILGKDSANAYAANGLGTVLAEKGEIFKAKEVFNRVREVSDDSIADALLNLGHIYLAQKKNSEALQLYQQYLTRIEDSNAPVTSKSRLDDIVDVLLYIAFAYFDWARHKELLNDSGAAAADGLYKEAMVHLEKGISRHPKKEVVLKYNLAMTKLQAANCVLQKLTRNIPRTVDEVQEALDGLEESLAVVEQIMDDKTENKKVPIPTSTLQNFLTHCRANIASAKSHLEDEKKRAALAEEEENLRKMALEEEMKVAALKAALKKEQEKKEEEERDLKAQATMQKVATLRDNWQKEQEAEKAEKEKKKKRPAADPNDFIEEDQPGGGDGGHGLFDDSDDSDGEDAATPGDQEGADKASSPPNKGELFGESDEEDESEPGAAAGDDNKSSKSPAPSKKSLFGDSDEESESGPTTTPAGRKALPSDLFGGDESDEEARDDADSDDEGNSRKRKVEESTKQPGTQGLFDSDADTSDDASVGGPEDPKRKKQRVLDDDDDDD